MSTSEQHVHFIGIGGYGMSAIARVMLEMGYRAAGAYGEACREGREGVYRP